MSESLTDEQLAAYERDIDTDVGILGEGRDQFRLRRLIQEVRRLRKLNEDYELEIRDMSIRKRRGTE